eukprot:scaffold21.g2175.t1
MAQQVAEAIVELAKTQAPPPTFILVRPEKSSYAHDDEARGRRPAVLLSLRPRPALGGDGGGLEVAVAACRCVMQDATMTYAVWTGEVRLPAPAAVFQMRPSDLPTWTSTLVSTGTPWAEQLLPYNWSWCNVRLYLAADVEWTEPSTAHFSKPMYSINVNGTHGDKSDALCSAIQRLILQGSCYRCQMPASSLPFSAAGQV